MESLIYWLALHCLPGLGCRRSMKLIDFFGEPKALFCASQKTLQELGLKAEAIQTISSKKWIKDAEEKLKKIEAMGVEIITYSETRYPALLKQIADPPPLLYLKGEAELLNTPSIAIVGARRASFYGLKIATKLATNLAELGITVVSGLARGIDAAAHKGALQANGNTIGVLGCGLDIVYPSENQKLYAEVEKQGALISEFPLGTPPLSQNFPVRNRLISGLSLGVVVVEAALRSGSLITARLALEQGREVFAVPGPINNFYSRGTHALIKQGAKLVENVMDVVEELNLSVSKDTSQHSNIKLDPVSERILSLLHTPKYLDEIALNLNENVVELSSILTLLEVQGLVKQLPGKQYIRVDV